MHYQSDKVLASVDRFRREILDTWIHPQRTQLTVDAWEVPGEPVSFEATRHETFAPFETGASWGRPWGTVWFRMTGHIPAHWNVAAADIEAHIDLGFTDGRPGFQAEGTVYNASGIVLGGVHPMHREIKLHAAPSDTVDLHVEASANPNVMGDFDFQPTPLGDLDTAGDDHLYRLVRADLVLHDREAWEFAQDMRTLCQLAAELDPASPRRAAIVRSLEMATRIDPSGDRASAVAAGRGALAEVLAAPAHHSAHRVVAVGHAHIDSAWLWPFRATVRKVTRSFANALELIDRHDDFVYVASSAQHFHWLQLHEPELFARVSKQVTAGRIVPVGGMWVEPDTNIPGGEALARQFLIGKRWFLDAFGIETQDAWLPDTFGYSAALPQLIALSGSRYFVTQKMSWNDTNTFPHHTFLWEGLDGTRVLTHFPPADTYISELSQAELAHAEHGFAEKGFANTSLVPFGWGDGGGGPTREMLAAAQRAADLEGSPKVQLGNPIDFFEETERELTTPDVWSGELYLELHRGVFTSRVATKQGNRRCEHLLREAELWASTATVQCAAPYPYEVFERIWRDVLLNQFHDVLTGVSIAWVHREVEERYRAIEHELVDIIDAALATLAGEGTAALKANAGPFEVNGVGPMAIGPSGVNDESPPSLVESSDGFLLANDAVKVHIDRRGVVTSLIDRQACREIIADGAPTAVVQVFQDSPTQYDAWDVERHDRSACEELFECDDIAPFDAGANAVGVRVVRRFGTSQITQDFIVSQSDRGFRTVLEVDWKERRRLLKLALPFDVHATHVASEIQFGHVLRPVHRNTSWDAARFEVCAHRWIHIGEPGFGVAVCSDSTYGHDAYSTPKPGGGITTTVRPSLVRGTEFPDPHADIGTHRFQFDIRTGAEIGDAIETGYAVHLPVRSLKGASPVESLVERSGDHAVIIESVKLAEDRSGDVMLRLYESRGGRATSRLSLSFDASRVVETDLLERPIDDAQAIRGVASRTIDLELRPFHIVTLRLTHNPSRDRADHRERQVDQPV